MTNHPRTRPFGLGLAALAGALLLVPPPLASGRTKTPPTADELLIVDCLLPHKTRRLGRTSTFLLPRKPLRTTAVDCRIRGGEHTQPDQASLATALAVWQPQAEAGDAEAQYYVGQIFEKGLGATADATTAARWYRQSAEQGYSGAQVALGYLYEMGLGVEQDDAEAMRWYRRAAGSTEDLVVLAQDDYAALVDARAALEREQEEAKSLRDEIRALQDEIERLRTAGDEARGRADTLGSLLERLRQDLDARENQVASAQTRILALESAAARASAAQATEAAGRTESAQLPRLDQLPFGRHHALVIGNSRYQTLPATPTGVRDAQNLAEVLEQRYGFDVTLLLDATRYDIMAALNELRTQLTEDDHLLVYYAGRGVRDAESQTAYWQPVDADAESPANWIPSAVVTEHLDIIPARHVFVVADSVYAGLRTRSSVATLPRGMTDEQRYFHIKLLLEKRSRLVLAAGSEAPVDGGQSEAGSSRFTQTLLDVLDGNEGVLEASALYREINRRLADQPADLDLDFATLKWARNDLGEFFFVPRS